MRELPKQLWAWIARLLPKQENSGSGAVQVGRAGGDVKVLHLTQHIYEASTQVGPPIQAATQSRPRATTSSTDQSQVLALMDRVPDRMAVLDFMAREFDTRMVIQLDPQQLYRLRRYVEVILNKAKQ